MNWLKQLLEMAQTLLRLTDDLKQTREDVKDLRREVRELSDAVKRLAYEVHRTQEREASEREKFMLRVENQLLKSKLTLPPASEEKE